MDAALTDLETIFKNWAWESYLNTSIGFFKRRLKFEHASIELKWDRVKQTLMEPIYKEEVGLQDNRSRQTVYVESEYENDTDHDQQHSFRTERETESTAKITIRTGLKTSVKTEIQLTLPPDMLGADDTESGEQTGTSHQHEDANQGQTQSVLSMKKQQAMASFGTCLDVDTEEGNTVRKSLKWAVDTTIMSKCHETTVACLEIGESKFKYNFSAGVRFKGRIVAVIRDNRSEPWRLVQTVEGDVATIINDMKTSQPHILRKVKLDTNDRTAIVTVAGELVFKYGVSQRVRIALAEKNDNVRSVYPIL